VILTHMNTEMLERIPGTGVEVAEDGMTVSI
jgi:hypothetical protein